MAFKEEGKKAMLEGFAEEAHEVGLYDDNEEELEGEGYERESLTLEYDSEMVGLVADKGEEDYVADFEVPEGTVQYVAIFDDTDTELAVYDLGEDAETFSNPGNYRLTDLTVTVEN